MTAAEKFNLVVLLIIVIIIPFWRSYFFFPNNKSSRDISPRNRLDFFDFLKGISIIAVIIIHAGYFFDFAGQMFTHSSFIYIISNLSRFAVPIFLICSGILLKPWGSKDDNAGFYQRKFFRIFLPYILLVSMMAVYSHTSFSDYIVYLLNGRALVPFYFIIILAQLYILYPLLSKYRNNKYFLSVAFILGFIMVNVFPIANIAGAEPFTGLLFFFAYGMHMRDFYLGEEKISNKQLYFWIALALVFLIITAALPAKYYNYQYFYALAIFNILYYYRDIIKRISGSIYHIIRNIGIYSLWIFLFHYLLEAQIYKIATVWPIAFIWQYLAIITITLILSYLLARILAFSYRAMLKQFDVL